jgi:hypothetical protein
MNASLHSRRARSLSALAVPVALLGAVALAACENDRPLGPKPTVIPTEASAAKIPQTFTFSVTILDQNGNKPSTTGAQFTVSQSGGQIAMFLVDNGAGDLDAAPNKLTMKVTNAATYTVCQTVAPTDYMLPNPACQSVMVGGIVPAALTFVDPTAAHVAWAVRDAFDDSLIANATFKDGQGNAITDNSPVDLDPTPGKIEVKTTLANFEVCPAGDPPGYVWFVASNTCVTTATIPAQTTTLQAFYANPEASIHWYINVSNYTGFGTEYAITAAEGGWALKLADNGPQDMIAGSGLVYLKVPKPGLYTVCQTVGPINGTMADPACQRIEVIYGQQNSLSFQSKPI